MGTADPLASDIIILLTSKVASLDPSNSSEIKVPDPAGMVAAPKLNANTVLEDELILETRQAFQIEGIDKAALKISDEIVNHLTVAGTPNECKNRIAAYREVGLQLPLLFPIEDCISYALETLRP